MKSISHFISQFKAYQGHPETGLRPPLFLSLRPQERPLCPKLYLLKDKYIFHLKPPTRSLAFNSCILQKAAAAESLQS